MKKFLLLLAVIAMAVSFTGCNNDGGGSSKSCWEFTITTKYTGTGSEYVDDMTIKHEQCDLTKTEAETVRKAFESKTTVGGMTMTVTAEKKKK